MSTSKDGSTIASRTSSTVGATGNRYVLIDQFISEPLQAQTITGTFTGQVRLNVNSTTSTTALGFVFVRIISNDGTSIVTEVGSATTTPLSTTLSNRTLISLNVGTLNITAGQRICVDLGWRRSVGTSTTRTGTASRGSSSGTDLPVDNSTTAVNNPWFQFSQNLVFLPPANDDCAGAISLTPGASCVNTAGTLNYATPNAATPLGCFAAGTYYDVWYKFVATTSTHIVDLSGLGANFTAPRIQIYQGSCAALVSMGCVSGTSLLQTGLTPGNTYYVRIANFNAD
ncbi:MAG: hypothetical protein JJE22_04640, partial [Bacteroidia bacterium]|nr:hypothetical protein [Bacteroidia bacterium]